MNRNRVVQMWNIGEGRIIMSDITHYYQHVFFDDDTYVNMDDNDRPVHWQDTQMARDYLKSCQTFVSDDVRYYVDAMGCSEREIIEALTALKEKKTSSPD